MLCVVFLSPVTPHVDPGLSQLRQFRLVATTGISLASLQFVNITATTVKDV
jgi:hypothetical protein